MPKDVKKADLPDLSVVKNDLAKKRAQLEARKEAREGLKATLTDGYKTALTNMSESEDDLMLSGDAVAIAEMLEAKRQEMVEDKLSAEDEEIALFEEAIEEGENQLDLLDTEHAFRTENPDLDIDGFKEYLIEDMSPRDKKMLLEESEGDQTVFLGKVAEKYLDSLGTGDGDKDGDDLPTDLSGIPGSGGDLDSGDEQKEDAAYMASIGFN